MAKTSKTAAPTMSGQAGHSGIDLAFNDLSSLFKKYAAAGGAPPEAEVKHLRDGLKKCEEAMTEEFGGRGLFMEFAADCKSVQLRVSDRDVNQSLRRLLEHMTTAKMAEEGDANNYFSILENSLEQAASKVGELAENIAGFDGKWLEVEGPGGLSRFNLVVAAHQLLDRLKKSREPQKDWQPQLIDFNLNDLEDRARRLQDLGKFLSAVSTKELVENALKADAVGIEAESRGLIAKATGRPALLLGAIVGILYVAFDYPTLNLRLPHLEPPVYGLPALALLAPPAAFFLFATLGAIARKARVWRVRKEIESHLRYLLNPAARNELLGRPRNPLDELAGKFGGGAGQAPVSDRRRQLNLRTSSDAGSGFWRRISVIIGGTVKFLSSALATVVFSMLPAWTGFGNVYLPAANSAEESLPQSQVSLLAKSEGREVCRLARGTLYAENDRAYFLKMADQRVEVSKSAVAMAVHGGDAAGIADCGTSPDTSKSVVFAPVINPSAVNNQVTAPVSLHMLQLPAPSPPPAITAMLPMKTYFIINDRIIGTPSEDGSTKRSIVLPFFPPKVKAVVGNSPRKEREAAYRYYYGDGDTADDVQNAPGLRAYVADVREAMRKCLAGDATLEIDIRGFASKTWKHKSKHPENTDDVLNHYLAEGRRMAVAREFGFYGESYAPKENGPFKLKQGADVPKQGLPEGAPPFRFGDFVDMQGALARWYTPRATPGENGLLEAMERSVVISYDESNLLNECQG